MMDNSTTFQGDGKVVYIPVVVNGKQAKSKCFSCKNKNVKTSYGYTVCNYSGSECRNFELYDPIKKTNELLNSFKEDFTNLLNEAKMILDLDEYDALIEWIEERI